MTRDHTETHPETIIERVRDEARVTIYDNITGDDTAGYDADMYHFTVPYTDSLSARIEANHAAWVAYAKEHEAAKPQSHIDADTREYIQDAVSSIISALM